MKETFPTEIEQRKQQQKGSWLKGYVGRHVRVAVIAMKKGIK